MSNLVPVQSPKKISIIKSRYDQNLEKVQKGFLEIMAVSMGSGFFKTETGLNSDLKSEIWLKSEFESASIPLKQPQFFC